MHLHVALGALVGIASYHNHSTWSDGSADVVEILATASELGLDEVGISDHLVLAPSGEPPPWSLPPERLPEYARDICRHQGRAGPRLRLGLEVDWFPGHGGAIERALAGYPWDFLIGSVHHLGRLHVDTSSAYWSELSPRAQEQRHREYWDCLRGLATSGLFDIVGHLDLTKKFGHRPRCDLSAIIARTLDAIADNGLVVELNTAGWTMPCAEAYPSRELLLACREREIPVMLAADAHHPGHLARHFGRAAQLLAELGFTELACFEGRRRGAVSLRPVRAALGADRCLCEPVSSPDPVAVIKRMLPDEGQDG